jgi:hypothetical protein
MFADRRFHLVSVSAGGEDCVPRCQRSFGDVDAQAPARAGFTYLPIGSGSSSTNGVETQTSSGAAWPSRSTVDSGLPRGPDRN